MPRVCNSPQGAQGFAPIEATEFADLMRNLTPCLAGQHIAVAVSGGADSLCLCLLAKAWADVQGILLTALTVDHGLRAESSAEAAQVAGWMQAHDIPHHILTWTHQDDVHSNIQARARQARYGLMADWCRKFEAKVLFVAHHLNDQAETVLMRLNKSSTLFGLSAMSVMRDEQGVVLFRPLLNIDKERLVGTLQKQGQNWIEDPSNQNTAFERVRVRQYMDTLNGQGVTAKKLVGAASGARAVCEIIDTAANRLITETSLHAKLDQMRLRIELLKAPDVILSRAVSKLLMKQGGGAYPPSPGKLERLVKWLKCCDLGACDARTLAGCLIQIRKNEIQIKSELPRKKCKNRVE